MCCSGSAGESAGRRGSRLGDLAIPAQVTRGPRPRPARRNRRGRFCTSSPRASGGGERRARYGTPAWYRRRWRQAAVGGTRPVVASGCWIPTDLRARASERTNGHTSEWCSRYDCAERCFVVGSFLPTTAGLGPNYSERKMENRERDEERGMRRIFHVPLERVTPTRRFPHLPLIQARKPGGSRDSRRTQRR